MRSKTLISLCIAFLALLFPAGADAACGACDEPAPGEICSISVAGISGSSNDVVGGPKCVRVENLNRLAFDIRVDKETELKDHPDLSQVFLNPGALLKQRKEVEKEKAELDKKSTEARTTGAETESRFLNLPAPSSGIRGEPGEDQPLTYRLVEPTQIESFVGQFEDQNRALEYQVWGSLNDLYASYSKLSQEVSTKADGVKSALETVETAQIEIAELVRQSDGHLQRGGAAELLKAMDPVKTKTSSAMAHSWPGDLQKLREGIEALQSTARDLRRPILRFCALGQEDECFDRYDKLVEDLLPSLLTTVDGLAEGGEKHKVFQEGQKALTMWFGIMGSLNEQSFRAEQCADCGPPFSKQKTHTIKMVRLDRLNKDAKPETFTLVTVECPQSFTTSFGFSIAGLSERNFKFVDAKADDGSLEQQIGFEQKSDEQVNAVLLLNALLASNDWGSFYASVGPTLELNNADSGVHLGFAAGISYGIRENWLLTLGAQIGRVRDLAGGFSPGDVVPQGLNEPPTEESWKTSWAVMFSYKVN